MTLVFESGQLSTDLTATPNADNLNISIESNNISLAGLTHIVRVLTMSPALRCSIDSMVVHPTYCPIDTPLAYSPSNWPAPYQYLVGYPADIQTILDIDVVSSEITACVHEFDYVLTNRDGTAIDPDVFTFDVAA